ETYPAMRTSVQMGCYNDQTHRPGFPELCASRTQDLHSETARLYTYGRRDLLDSCHFPLRSLLQIGVLEGWSIGEMHPIHQHGYAATESGKSGERDRCSAEIYRLSVPSAPPRRNVRVLRGWFRRKTYITWQGDNLATVLD